MASQSAHPDLPPTRDAAFLEWVLLRLRGWATTHLTGIGFSAITVVAAAIRLHAFDRASLWLDEGSTVYFSRLPWADVLGFRGGYDTHPPLYYALVKATSLVVGDVDAGRLVSVAGGTLSVLLLLMVADRLAGRNVALAAGVCAATAPLLVWYSQEARQYETTSVAVVAAYLALVAYYRRPRIWVAIGYLFAVVTSMYLDYSAVFALAPHLVIVGYLVVSQRRAALPILLAAAGAVVAYLPWLPFISSTVSSLGTSRAGFLGVSMTALIDALRSIIGISGSGIYYATLRPPSFQHDPLAQAAVGALALVVLVGGLAALASRPLRWLVGAGLSLGTVGAAVALSTVSPGFAPRTVSYAVFGWALILGAAAAGRIGLPSWPRRGLRTASVALVMVPILSLPSIYAGEKQHFRELAHDTLAVVHATGFPLLLHPTFTPALISAYEPQVGRYDPTTVYDDPDSRVIEQLVGNERAVIVSYMGVPRTPDLIAGLEAAGLDRIMHAEYFYGLALDVWARPGAALGSPVPVDLGFSAAGWSWPPGATVALQTGSGELELADATPGEEGAVRLLPATPRSVYVFRFRARLLASDGTMRAFLICSAADGAMLTVSPDGRGAAIPNDGQWHAVRFAGYCPAGTTTLRLDLRNAGGGALLVADPELRVMSPHDSRGGL